MEEKFLHHIWKQKLFRQFELFTSKGERVEIIQPGEYNTQSGPDFFNALIKINGQLLAGNLEIHTRSSDWNVHGHQRDNAYDNVILHVVYEDDEEIFTGNNKLLPTLELKGLIQQEYFNRYEALKNSKHELACGRNAGNCKAETIAALFSSRIKERIESKAGSIHEVYIETGKDWLETFYICIARSFGFKINSLPFYLLAKHLPFKILQRHADDPHQIEALLLGQAGLLEGFFEEKYACRLQNEYEFLKQKYSLLPLKQSLWKSGGLRPQNFPAVRLAQFAALIPDLTRLFNEVKNGADSKRVRELLSISPSVFWDSHYSPDKPAAPRPKKTGEEAIDIICINTIAPFVFQFGKLHHNIGLMERAAEFLAEIKAENNAVVRLYTGQGLKVKNASETQALLHHHQHFCRKKKCLDCEIGKEILADNTNSQPVRW